MKRRQIHESDDEERAYKILRGDKNDKIVDYYYDYDGDDDAGEGPSKQRGDSEVDSGFYESNSDGDIDSDDDDRYSMHSAYSNRRKGRRPSPNIYAVISGMGTGKTAILRAIARMMLGLVDYLDHATLLKKA